MTKKTKKNKKGVQGRSRTPPRSRSPPRNNNRSRRSPAPSPKSISPIRRRRSRSRNRTSARDRRSRAPSSRKNRYTRRFKPLSQITYSNLQEETIRGYSHAIIELLNKNFELGMEYYPNINSDKPIQYFKDTYDNLVKNMGDTDIKIKKIINNISDSDLNYLLIDGENIFYGMNDEAAIGQELVRLSSLTNAGCIFLFCQEHSIKRGGKFYFLHETPDKFFAKLGKLLIIDGPSRTELDDIYLVMAEKLIRSRKGYASCSIGTGYPRTSCRRIIGNRINIYTNDNFGWS